MRVGLALLALLLLAATPLPQQPQTASATESPNGASEGAQRHAATEEPAPFTQQDSADDHEDKGARDDPERNESLELNRLLTVYTGQLATYTWLLVVVGFLQLGALAAQVIVYVRTLRATTTAANAARDSAEIADATLRTHRPLLSIIDCRVTGLTKPYTAESKEGELSGLWVHFKIKNAGLSPAIIELPAAGFVLFSIGTLPPKDDFSRCRPLSLPDSIIKPDGTLDALVPYETGELSEREWKEVVEHESQLILFGSLLYKGTRERVHYPKDFLLIWESHDRGASGFFRSGPPDRNKT